MIQALDLARSAGDQEETPVGAVVVVNGQVTGKGFNRVEMDRDPTAHAEMVALREATRNSRDWRLPTATLYVTLEPCIMCAAALIHARIKCLVFGTHDERWGGMGSLFDFSHDPRMNHEVEVISGVMEQECSELLKTFYKKLRNHLG